MKRTTSTAARWWRRSVSRAAAPYDPVGNLVGVTDDDRFLTFTCGCRAGAERLLQLLLTSVPGWGSSIGYQPNGTIAKITHQNNAVSRTGSGKRLEKTLLLGELADLVLAVIFFDVNEDPPHEERRKEE